jgi:NAD-dependent DNA ligase
MELENIMDKFRVKNEKYLDKIDFNGKWVAFTGTLKSMTRTNAKMKIAEKGGMPTESAYSCYYLVAAEFTSKKYKTALSSGAIIISESDFLRGIN